MTGATLHATEEPVQVRLGPVQETLLIPVYARALETARPRPLFRDAMSTEMVRRIDYDLSRFDQATNVIRDVVVRTDLLDERVAAFIAGNPFGQVINLGAGLDTRLSRLDNSSIHWVDLDIPDAIELRAKFFASGERKRMIPQSMFEPDWFERTFKNVPPE